MMKTLLKIIGCLFALILIVGAYLFFYHIPVNADREMNHVRPHETYQISDEAAALHATLRVSDLHSDMLLWMRNPLKRHDRGHTDVPRLQEGRVAVQVFSAVTKTPVNLNYESNTAESDNITLLAIAQRWPVKTWGSIYERAVYQAERLYKAEKHSKGELIVVETKANLLDALQKRKENPNILAGILATEGAHPLEGKIENLDGLYDAGYRMIGLQHFFDNELGGSLHGTSNAGLTPFGKEVVKKLVEKDMMIDVAHSSHQVVRDVLEMTDVPLVVSHTGVYSACNTKRNIPDDLMRQITERGGLIGIGYWEDVTCDDTPMGVAKVIKYAAEKFGVEHIALGSDYDGTVITTFDTSELAALTDALLDLGMSEDHIRMVMGENAIRFYLENLPE